MNSQSRKYKSRFTFHDPVEVILHDATQDDNMTHNGVVVAVKLTESSVFYDVKVDGVVYQNIPSLNVNPRRQKAA